MVQTDGCRQRNLYMLDMYSWTGLGLLGTVTLSQAQLLVGLMGLKGV